MCGSCSLTVLVVSCVRSSYKQIYRYKQVPKNCGSSLFGSFLVRKSEVVYKNRLIGSSFLKRARMLESMKTPDAGKLLP